jgi:hypothetical protein
MINSGRLVAQGDYQNAEKVRQLYGKVKAEAKVE